MPTPRVNSTRVFYEEQTRVSCRHLWTRFDVTSEKEVHARLDFEESTRKKRIREGSQNSSVRTLSARYRNPSERLKVRERLRYNDRHIILEAETAPVAPKNHMIIPAPPLGQGPNVDIARATETALVMRKKGRESESPSSRVSESGTSDGEHWKSRRPWKKWMIHCHCLHTGKASAAGNKKGHTRTTVRGPQTSSSGMLQNRGLTSEVSQRKDGGLASLPTEAGKFKLPPPMVTPVEN
ncbi:hypothetical protein Tco_1171841 [Tanacetum coccineum]